MADLATDGSPSIQRSTESDLPTRFVSAIDSAGARAQKVGFPAIAILVVLFFGLILPSMGTLEDAHELRNKIYGLDHQKKILDRKRISQSLNAPRSPSRRDLEGCSEKKNGIYIPIVCKDFSQDLHQVEIALGELEDKIERAARNHSPKEESLTQIVAKDGKSVEDKLRAVEGSYAAEHHEAAVNPNSYIRPLRYRLASLKLSARREDLKHQLTSESSSTISLRFLGVFGIKLEGFEEARVPLLYLPVLWSLILLALLLYVLSLRSTMLTLYARALQVIEKDSLLDHIEITKRSRWWWLAPLPKKGGRLVSPTDLRYALGWQRFELIAIVGVLVLLLSLLLMQAVVVMVSSRVTQVLTEGREASVILAVVYATALVNLLSIARWLWPWRSIPDFEANEETTWYYRRFILSIIVLGLIGSILPSLLLPPERQQAIHTNPRFRRRRGSRAIEADSRLSVGFYRNIRTNVVHYVSLWRFPEVRIDQVRRKRHRIRLLRVEQVQRHLQLRQLSSEIRRRTHAQPRLREGKLSRHVPKPDRHNPKQLVIRGAGSLDIDNLVPVSGEELEALLAARNPDSGSTAAAMSGRSLPPLHSPAQIIQPMNGIKDQEIAQGPMKHAHIVATASLHPKIAKQEIRHPPSLSVAQASFAIEQEVLRILCCSQSSAVNSDESRTVAVGKACQLLKGAIERGVYTGPCVRVMDLLAVVALRNDRPDVLQWLIDFAKINPRHGNLARALKWSGESNWRARWGRSKMKGKQRSQWAGLPM